MGKRPQTYLPSPRSDYREMDGRKMHIPFGGVKAASLAYTPGGLSGTGSTAAYGTSKYGRSKYSKGVRGVYGPSIYGFSIYGTAKYSADEKAGPGVRNTYGAATYWGDTDELDLVGDDAVRIYSDETRIAAKDEMPYGNYAQFADDGHLTLHGTARVYRDVPIQISSMKKGVGSPPGESLEDGFPTLDFDDGNDEEVFVLVHSPHDYAAGTVISFHIEFFVDAVDAVNEKNVVWGIEVKVIQHGSVFDFSSGTLVTYMEHAIPITTSNKTLLSCDGLTIGPDVLVSEGLLIVRLFRDADSTGGDDSHVGDARVLYAHLHYTADKLGEEI